MYRCTAFRVWKVSSEKFSIYILSHSQQRATLLAIKQTSMRKWPLSLNTPPWRVRHQINSLSALNITWWSICNSRPLLEIAALAVWFNKTENVMTEIVKSRFLNRSPQAKGWSCCAVMRVKDTTMLLWCLSSQTDVLQLHASAVSVSFWLICHLWEFSFESPGNLNPLCQSECSVHRQNILTLRRW